MKNVRLTLSWDGNKKHWLTRRPLRNSVTYSPRSVEINMGGDKDTLNADISNILPGDTLTNVTKETL